jgi:hypothetical protein
LRLGQQPSSPAPRLPTLISIVLMSPLLPMPQMSLQGRTTALPNLLQNRSPVGSRSPACFGLEAIDEKGCNQQNAPNRKWLESQYPVNIVVKNTFIDVMPMKSMITRRRRSLTCPTPKCGEKKPGEGDIAAMARELNRPQVTENGSAASASSFPNSQRYDYDQPCTTAPASRHVVSLAQALANEPCIGSALHYEAGCKPCVFFHTKGCTRGTECQFCHLCEKDTIKKQRKERRDVMRKVARAQM